MKKLVAFDLDGTLAASKQPIEPDMAEALADLLGVVDVAVISGGDWSQFDKQVARRLPERADRSRLWLMPTTGTKLYTFRAGEWSADEIYLSLPRPGGDGWLSIDRASGEVDYEVTRRGAVAYLNDLHKGRNAGPVWGWFIDVFALACLVFSITGLFLLKFHAARRASTWPLVALGLVLPVLLALIFIH